MQKSLNQKYGIEKTFKSEKIKTILFVSGKTLFTKLKRIYFLIKFLKIKENIIFLKNQSYQIFKN